MSTELDLKKTIIIPLFTAMTAVGAYIAIPLPWSPVPLVVQNFFIFLAGLVLGSRMGAASVGLYLFLGALGLPVFAGGTGGLAHFAGPTAGYLISYLPTVIVIGMTAKMLRKRTNQGRTGLFLANMAAALIGVLLVYLVGVTWLKIRLGLDWEKAVFAGLLPFIAGDVLKAAAAAALAPMSAPSSRKKGSGTANDGSPASP